MFFVGERNDWEMNAHRLIGNSMQPANGVAKSVNGRKFYMQIFIINITEENNILSIYEMIWDTMRKYQVIWEYEKIMNSNIMFCMI